MEREFDQLARRGENQPWRWLLSGGILLVCWWVCLYLFGAFVINVPAMLGAGGQDQSPLLANLLDYAVTLASFAVVLLGLMVAARFVHRRPLLSFVTPGSRFRWNRLATGFVVWTALSLVLTFVNLLQEPERYEVLFEPVGFVALVVLALLLVPVKVAAQSLFFGGYLLQGMGLVTRSTLLVLAFVGLAFAATQLSGLVFEGFGSFLGIFVYWFFFGAFLAFLALRDNGLELVLGLYLSQSLFTSLLFDYEYSVVPQPAVFVIAGPGMSEANFVLLVFALVLFYLTVFRVLPRDTKRVK